MGSEICREEYGEDSSSLTPGREANNATGVGKQQRRQNFGTFGNNIVVDPRGPERVASESCDFKLTERRPRLHLLGEIAW